MTNISDNIFVELHVGGADHQSWQQVCSQLGFRVRERYRGLIVCKISDSVVAGLHDNVWTLGPSATLEHCGELGFRLRERDRGLIVCNRAIILSLDCMIMYELLVRPKLWNIVGLDVSSVYSYLSIWITIMKEPGLRRSCDCLKCFKLTEGLGCLEGWRGNEGARVTCGWK